MAKKVELKTKERPQASVSAFLNDIKDVEMRKDAKAVVQIMKKITGKKPKMWGTSMIGFGTYTYKRSTGQEGEYFIVGLSPRAKNLTIYIMPGYQDFGDLLVKLGPHKKGKSCLYIKHLSDLHIPTLKKMITLGWKHMLKNYPTK